ncbi:MAG: hypothetical protein JKY81_05840 [Colwellia sp.]|nr:hypothetical protein [Colwellia sp.]
MNTKFTKGEWSIYIGSENMNARTVCKLSASTSILSSAYVIGDLEGDANLIAAAPDMYNKLGELLTFLEVMHEADTSWTIKESISFHKEVGILLKKARGE